MTGTHRHDAGVNQRGCYWLKVQPPDEHQHSDNGLNRKRILCAGTRDWQTGAPGPKKQREEKAVLPVVRQLQTADRLVGKKNHHFATFMAKAETGMESEWMGRASAGDLRSRSRFNSLRNFSARYSMITKGKTETLQWRWPDTHQGIEVNITSDGKSYAMHPQCDARRRAQHPCQRHITWI